MAGCGPDPVAEDIAAYRAKVNEFVTLEVEAGTAFESVTGANAKDDEELVKTMVDTVIPKYREFIDRLEAVQPQTEEVRALHEKYVAAANKQFTAFSQMTSIPSIMVNIGAINQSLAEARAEIRAFLDELEKLEAEHKK